MIPNWLSLNIHKTYRMETLKIILLLVFVWELRNLDLESYTYCPVYSMSHVRYKSPISCMRIVHAYLRICIASLYVHYTVWIV